MRDDKDRSEKSAAVVQMNLLELPKPLLKRHARLRVGTPANSVSKFIAWEHDPRTPKRVAEQRAPRIRAIATTLRTPRSRPMDTYTQAPQRVFVDLFRG